MKIIFLDIDGVLNTERYIVEQSENDGKPLIGHHYNFDPLCMQRLKKIIETTNAKVVICSTWRIWWDPESKKRMAIYKNFEKYNIDTNRIIDITPVLWSKERGIEIRSWLQDKNDIESFVIIDDDDDMCEFIETNLVKCNCRIGITDKVKNKSIDILMRRKKNEKTNLS